MWRTTDDPHCLLKFNRLGLPDAEFECHEPDTAWCPLPAQEPPDLPHGCWFTVLARGFSPWGRRGTY